MALIEKLEAIGDAIRAKTGKTEEMTLDQMPIEIAGIPTGGGGDTMVGTWTFNNVLDLPEFDYYFNFVLTNVVDSRQFYNLYSEGDGTLYYFDVDDNDTVAYENGAWIYPEYQTITITEEPTDPELVKWIKANARRLGYEDGYEDGYAEGEKAILSTYIDWTISAASDACIVDFYNDCGYYAHIYFDIAETVGGGYHYEEFVIAPYDSYSISTEEIGMDGAQGAIWAVTVTVMKFSKDGDGEI